MARKYQHTMALLPRIKEMQAQGMTQKQIENALGLTEYPGGLRDRLGSVKNFLDRMALIR